MGGGSSAFDYDGQLAKDKTLQTIEVGEELKGETRVRRCKAYPELVKYPYPEEKGGLKTVWEAFQRGVTKFGDNKLYGTRTYEFDEKTGKYVKDAEGIVKRGKYVWESYKDIDKVVRAFGSGLVELKAQAKDNIGIWGINRTEWMVASLATYSQNMRTVALYASLGEDAVEYIINHADIPIVITEKENVKKLIHLLPKLKTVRTIIQMDPNPLYNNQADKLDDAEVKACAEAKVQLIGFQEVVKLGADKHFPVEPAEGDLAFIMYTSGTTGQPKGAMLGHGNLMANMATTPLIVPLKGVDDVHISYLPLAHIFETIVQVGIIMQGGSIGYFQGNVKKLFTDFADLEPTIVCGVPRIYGRIYQRVMAGVGEKNCIARYFFHKFYNTQASNIRAGKPRDAKADQKVFIPLRTKMGMGKTRIVLTGAAPCPPYLMEFLKVLTGGMVLQGYGLTETCAGTNSSLPNDPNVGHVGPPLPCIEEKLRDVPEMGYLSTDKPCPRGEVLVRGASVFQGYFKNEKATAECLDKDGWFSTGDIGRWNPNGTLSIIDRKKNLFKLSQGEYIASEKIESVYAKASTVGQVWVYGNSYKSFVLAVVVPAAEFVAKHAVKSGWWPSTEPIAPGTEKFSADFAKVWEGPHKAELKEFVLAAMRTAEGKELKGFEVVKDIHIEYKIDAMMSGFTEANECLTPSFKLRRPYLLRRYKEVLKELYAKHGEPNAPDEKWPGEP